MKSARTTLLRIPLFLCLLILILPSVVGAQDDAPQGASVEYPPVALETSWTSSLNATAKVRNIVIYDKVILSGQERYGNYDYAKASLSPWTSGGGHLAVGLTDQDQNNNVSEMQSANNKTRAFVAGYKDFWSATLQAAGFTVVQKSWPINPIPDNTSVWVYWTNVDDEYSHRTEVIFRTNNPQVVLYMLQMYQDAASEFEDTYPLGRIDLN